jgi:hypothetical protein
MEGDIRARFAELGNTVLDNPEFSSVWVKTKAPNPELTDLEQEMLFTYARSYWLVFVSIETAFINGLISEDTFIAYLNILPVTLRRYPGFAPFFEEFLTDRTRISSARMADATTEVLGELGIIEREL